MIKNIVSIAWLILPYFLCSQDAPFIYNEVLEQPYMPVARINKPTSPAYRLDGSAFTIRQVNVDAEGRNILQDAANEPSLVIDPTNPQRIAIGWRQFDTIASNFRQAGVAFSMDGGNTWNNQKPIQQAVFRSDPVLDTDKNGNFFYNSLTSENGLFYCNVFKAEAGSDQWSTGVYAYGGDKQWMVIDRTEGEEAGNVYTNWNSGFSSCNGGFTRSLDAGENYEECEFIISDPKRGTLAVDPSGILYVCGGDGNSFSVVKSSQPGAADFTWDKSKRVNLGGSQGLYGGPNPSGLLGQVWIDVDHSFGQTRGYVYLLATVSNSSDPSDIMFARSTDEGNTWEAPVRINNDAVGSNWQWFGSLSVAPTGRIDVTWYDTRDNPGTFHSRLYYSYSTDGGLTWSANEGLSDSFDPHVGWPQQNKIGDYNHQRSDEEGVHLAWAATFNGEQDVYYSYISTNVVSGLTAVDSKPITAAPNPTSDNTTFHFTLDRPGKLSLQIFDAQGRVIDVLVREKLNAGRHHIEWNGFQGSGLHFYRLLLNEVSIGEGKIMRW